MTLERTKLPDAAEPTGLQWIESTISLSSRLESNLCVDAIPKSTNVTAPWGNATRAKIERRWHNVTQFLVRRKSQPSRTINQSPERAKMWKIPRRHDRHIPIPIAKLDGGKEFFEAYFNYNLRLFSSKGFHNWLESHSHRVGGDNSNSTDRNF